MNENTNNSIQESEIELKDFVMIIWKNKFKLIFFTFIITSLSIAFALTKPNSYKSSIILAPQEQAKPSLGGGLGALAGLAGVDLGGGSLDAFTSMKTTLNDFTFNKHLIEKYNLSEKLSLNNFDKNLVFALNYDTLYNYMNKNDEKDNRGKEEVIFDTYRSLQEIFSLSSDKKTGTITFSATFVDRFLAKELLEIYLKEITTHIRKMDMKDISKKIDYYNKELELTQDIELKTQLSTVLSGLVQKRVLSQASEHYIVKKLTEPTVPFIKDKVGPKRALTVVVSFVTSIIFGIFLLFFIEYIKGNREKQ